VEKKRTCTFTETHLDECILSKLFFPFLVKFFPVEGEYEHEAPVHQLVKRSPHRVTTGTECRRHHVALGSGFRHHWGVNA
jgi:hypothetical protein